MNSNASGFCRDATTAYLTGIVGRMERPVFKAKAKGSQISVRLSSAPGFWNLSGLIIPFVIWSCGFKKETVDFKLKLENLFHPSPKWVQACEVSSLGDQLPWSEWELDWFRPKNCNQALFESLEGDTIHLFCLQFPTSYLAFGLFNKQVSLFLKGRNYFFAGKTALLQQDNQLFSLHLSGENGWNLQKLSTFCKQLDSTGTKPKVFDSFPVHGRIPNSETVIPHYFMGIDFFGEVIGVQYPCYYDTAFVFRSFFNPDQSVFIRLRDIFTGKTEILENGKVFQFWGYDEFNQPVLIWGFSGGLIGCSGCSDSNICQELAQKTKIMNVLLPKKP